MRLVNGVAIVDLTGAITVGQTSAGLKNRLSALLEQGHTRILLNLAEVTHVDSSGLGEMVSFYSSTVRKGGLLKLLNPNKSVSDLLRFTRLDTLLEVCRDEVSAVAGFSSTKLGQGRQSLSEFLD